MTILTNGNIPVGLWNDLLVKSGYGSPFQSHEFYSIINNINGLSAEAIAVECNNQLNALAVVTIHHEQGIRSIFSRRGIIYGGPLIGNQDADSLGMLLNCIDTIFKTRCIYVETRNFNNYSNYPGVFESREWRYMPYVNFIIKTSDLTEVKSNLSESRKRQINKSLRNGATWSEAKSAKEVDEFYDILQILYKKKVRKPLLPVTFFQMVHESNIGKILLVRYNDKIIGGILMMIFEKFKIYEFYVCGLDKEHEGIYPSVLATWAALEFASINGFEYFDFMGAGLKDQDYGVRDFKARFGGQQIEYGRYLKVYNKLLYTAGKSYIKLRSLH